MNYHLDNWQVGIVKGDQKVSMKFYKNSLIIKNFVMIGNPPPRPSTHSVNFVYLDPREEYMNY